MMYRNFDNKTQGYIDSTLATLNTWFGTNSPFKSSTPATPSPANSNMGDGSGNKDEKSGRRNQQPSDDGKNKTGLYIGIGAGVLVIGGLTFYLIKRRKK